MNGRYVVVRKTDRKRLRLRLLAIKQELRTRLHDSPRVVGQWLGRVVQGYLQYHAVPGNSKSICAFRYHVVRLWFRALKRRSQRHSLTWDRFGSYANRWIPKARILHPWPIDRFYATHPR
jgi:hypothetical protein